MSIAIMVPAQWPNAVTVLMLMPSSQLSSSQEGINPDRTLVTCYATFPYSIPAVSYSTRKFLIF